VCCHPRLYESGRDSEQTSRQADGRNHPPPLHPLLESRIGKHKTLFDHPETARFQLRDKGRGAETLKPFDRRLAAAKAKVKAIAMDMASGYTAWATDTLPDAVVVYDHFHLIKLMNEKLDKVRRRLVNDLDESQTKFLKKSGSCC